MKIAFDGRYAEGDLVGVGKYIVSLVEWLSQHNVRCIIFYSKTPKYPISGKNISSRVLPSLNRYVFEQIKLPIALQKEKVDIYHALGNIGIPIFCPVPSVLTVHDIIPVLVKDYFKDSKYFFLSRVSYLLRLKTSIFKAEKIITVSEFTKKSLIKTLKVQENKIIAILSGAPHVSFKSSRLPKGLTAGKYILNQGGIDIRKNLDNLIKAFAKALPKIPEFKLVITGRNERMGNDLKYLTRDLNIDGNVVFPGYLEEENVWSLIRQAKCICYPSLIEGFGFPILEGFSAGTPVITSNNSSLSEISGQAAYLVNPEGLEELSQAILNITKDQDLRNKLISRGEERIKDFSWDKTGREVLKIYENVTGNHRS